MSGNNASSSKASDTKVTDLTRRAQQVSTTVNNTKLHRLEPESIRHFLDLYDQYVSEVQARARQFSDDDISTEASKPAVLKFYVDIGFPGSTIALGEIRGVGTYNGITDAVLQPYLDNEAAESHTKVMLNSLDALVEKNHRMDMRHKDISSRIKNLFLDYQTLLRKNGLTWIVTEI